MINIIDNIFDIVKIHKDKKQVISLYKEINEAKLERDIAKNIFENVTHEELIDMAIYKIYAAEKKYIYLLNQLKEESNNIEKENAI